MIKEPWFWRDSSLTARAVSTLLSPLGGLYNFSQKIIWNRANSFQATIPVICVGNASLGGVGKTPFAMMLAADYLNNQQQRPHFLTRGHGGTITEPVRFDPQTHQISDAGDEAFLLARHAPVWIARNRAFGAKCAAGAGATSIIMDDGFQNPSLAKSFSFLLVDNSDPEGNGRIFPAGPMREPLTQAADRADAIIAVKKSNAEPTHQAITQITTNTPLICAWLSPDTEELPDKVIAFCGIGNPQRFFDMLENYGTKVVARYGFPDHHRYSAAELDRLRKQAKKLGAPLMTTEKDFVRLQKEDREDISFLPVKMSVDDPEMLKKLLATFIETSDNNESSVR